MPLSQRNQSLFIWIALGLLTVSAFFVRLDNFKNSRARTIDEAVYYRMALQIQEDPLDYNTVPYGRELAARGRDLPKYFFAPLFKHPPFFTYLVALSLKIFGSNMTSAAYIPIFFGVAMIPLVYLFARFLFDHRVALLAAIFMWLDPVNIICSQKVWMETTLAFFTLLTIYLFVLAERGKSSGLFVLSGLAAGCAVLTKYPGILAWMVVLLYSALYKRELFKNTYFLISLTTPFVMLLPWWLWNFFAFGTEIFGDQASINHLSLASPRTWLLILIFGVFLSAALYMIICRKNLSVDSLSSPGYFRWIRLLLAFALGVSISEELLLALNPVHIPVSSWRQGLFWGEKPDFYFGRLLEFSFLFIFSYLSFFVFTIRKTEMKRPLWLASAVIFIFYMAWGSFQSRYILAAVPFLIILGVVFWSELLDKAETRDHFLWGFCARIALKAALVLIAVKTMYINMALSYTNDMCYF